MRFQTELEMYEGSHGMWIVAHMPFDARTEFGSGGIIRVHGTVNGFPFHSSIFPHRSGRHFLMVNKKMPDFGRKALGKSPVAMARWQKLAKSHKRNFMIYLMDGKSQPTRERRAAKMTKMLLEKGHF